MFDDEADTISLDVTGALEIIRTGTIEVVIIDAEIGLRDTSPVEAIEFEDTPIFTPLGTGIDLHPTLDEAPPTDKMRTRPATDGDWPPPPKPPTTRSHRRAGVYKAITSITKVTKLKS